MTLRPGLVLAGIFLCIYGTLALAVDFPRAAYSFHSDEATYYMMGQSLVHDRDLSYRREDLVRVWKEFPGGPAGLFLKHGQTLSGKPDHDQRRYFYGKSFIYPLFAAPFIAIFGTKGFLVLHALLLALVLLCGYLFLHARSGPWPSALLSASFVMASVVPVYFVWIMPELFNFSLAFLAYFCWLYKEVARPELSARGTAWLFTPRSDLVMAVLLGIATFSKPTNALLFVAPLAWGVFKLKFFRLKGEASQSDEAEATQSGSVASGFSRKDLFRRKILLPVVAFAAVAGGLFAINMAISGDWNYQGGGDRKSYYYEFPFQTEGTTNQLGVSKSRESAMTHIIFNPRTFTSNLLHNLEYFFIGRYAGMLGYYFPGLFAMLALLAAPRKRAAWQWLVLAAALVQGLIFVVATPYTWSGGGVGNRYFAGGYGVMLFLLPPIESIAAAFVPWAIGGLFVAPMVLNPFLASFRPNENAKGGPLRLLPVELTLLNDLPVFTEGESRARVWMGDTGQGDPGFLVSFLDDNAYGREEDRSFWTRGDSRAELVFKADKSIRKAVFTIAAGPQPVDVTLRLGSKRYDVHVDAASTQQIIASMPQGLIYEKEVEGVHLWLVSITTKGGFTPIFYDEKASDARYLGARIKPMLETRPQ
ncbi:MAG TPA: hypothetical protein VEL51_25130 [Vicinamibacterales bacterium]|nr:hypothetical protein [Vicinamibacterales bacterium]